MKLHLDRFADAPDGVFGRLTNEDRTFVVFTLEPPWSWARPYDVGGPVIKAIPTGTYSLAPRTFFGGDGPGGAKKDYATYGIYEIPKASDVMFHIGNRMRDTHKCVLLGQSVGAVLDNGVAYWTISQSKVAFDRFMAYMNGVKTGSLSVRWAVGE